MDAQLSHGLRVAIGQIRTSSHQLMIETGRWSHVAANERMCQLCGWEAETEEHEEPAENEEPKEEAAPEETVPPFLQDIGSDTDWFSEI